MRVGERGLSKQQGRGTANASCKKAARRARQGPHMVRSGLYSSGTAPPTATETGYTGKVGRTLLVWASEPGG